MATADLSNPIINSPYDPPEPHFEIGPSGPTGRDPAGPATERVVHPVPVSRKGAEAGQQALDFDITGERREQNSLINDIRREVERWRANNWNGVTPYTPQAARPLGCRAPDRDEPVLFCQREAAETAIFLTEVAGRHGTADYRRRLEPENQLHNDGLPRVGLKMATGTGKTVVMAMIIAWQTINKVMTPERRPLRQAVPGGDPGHHDPRPAGVLHPERDDNYYRERDLVPAGPVGRAAPGAGRDRQLPRLPAPGLQGDPGRRANTRKLLRGGKPEVADAFRETPDMVAARILRAFGTGKGEIVVLNDEAHHCYQDKLLDIPTTRPTRKTRTATVTRGSGSAGLQRPATQGRHQDRLRPVGHARTT